MVMCIESRVLKFFPAFVTHCQNAPSAWNVYQSEMSDSLTAITSTRTE